ncbi:MAG: c-type cytochrome, partial [Nitrospinota bacterium]
ALPPAAAKGFRLISDLHCNACHYIGPELKHGKAHARGHGVVAPDLSFPGDKFRPDWLYEFLRKPHPFRPWLKTRMPDFRLTEAEGVALVRHLTRDMRNPHSPPLPPEPKVNRAEKKARLEGGRRLMSEEYLGCWECHQRGEEKPKGPREGWAPDLETSGRRLRPEWIVRWFRNPQGWMPGTKMPSYFEDADSGPEDILGGDEDKQIYAIRDYILSLSAPPKGHSAFDRARQRHPNASRAQGARLMSELNCAGCHEVGGMHEREEAGPPLAHEGSRVKRQWLLRFLRKPFKYRPMGYVAGAASRHPDLGLSKEESEAIAAYLMTRVDERVHVHQVSTKARRAKAKRGKRLYSVLRCGSCHERAAGDGKPPKGGMHFEGPNLSRAGLRLKEEHLKLWLAGEITRSGSELEMDAHPLVPKLGLRGEQIADLAAYLVTRK